MSTFDRFVELIPKELLDRSGAVFYSGRTAFSNASSIYLLGINPGGDPRTTTNQTVGSQIEYTRTSVPSLWSAYRDEQWRGKRAGAHGMQPRVQHLCEGLGVNPGTVPASNLVFARSRREALLDGNFRDLADLCWPFHDAVIAELKVRLIVCFGQTVGRYVRNRFDANAQAAEFREHNRRQWKSTIHFAPGGLSVATLTHPGIAAWNRDASDPTPMVRNYLRTLT